MRLEGHLQRIHRQQHQTVIHYFSEHLPIGMPERFNDPFRYSPHPYIRSAARSVIRMISSSEKLSKAFSEGKMIGVLLTEHDGRPCYLAAFSGNVGGHSMIDGFVPPIFDLMDPEGRFKKEESSIILINKRIEEIEGSSELHKAESELRLMHEQMETEIAGMKERIKSAKEERERIRTSNPDSKVSERLIRESQFEKAQLKRLKDGWRAKINTAEAARASILLEVENLKKERARMSDELQDWIFRQYRVHNALGECASISDIFAETGSAPPGGTGECAAPKLLEYAYRNGLKPLAMGEFWYGESSGTAVRSHGHFYPSCTSKCGPLLEFMTKGLDIGKEDHGDCSEPEIIYTDSHLTAVRKPSGMPSVPGLDGRLSLQEWLTEHLEGDIHPIHRLDMDTSGIILFARTHEAAVDLRKQFEEHSIRKTYLARLSPSDQGVRLLSGATGTIDLPLGPDYDERPRQKVDRTQGKHAVTEYEVTEVNSDGSIDIIFHPLTGRTHQLRVHSAHKDGLGHPISGDLLYGGSPASRLALHSHSISFRHPESGDDVTLSC